MKTKQLILLLLLILGILYAADLSQPYKTTRAKWLQLMIERGYIDQTSGYQSMTENDYCRWHPWTISEKDTSINIDVVWKKQGLTTDEKSKQLLIVKKKIEDIKYNYLWARDIPVVIHEFKPPTSEEVGE